MGWWIGGLVDGLDWWAGVAWWIGGLVEWKLAAWGSEVCKSILARATAMGRRIINKHQIINDKAGGPPGNIIIIIIKLAGRQDY